MSALDSRFLVEGSGHDMGKRREPRKEIRVAVRIFGTDRGGQLFSEKVFTVNVSQQGVELSGVQAQPNVDEIVGITHGVTKAHFRVKWVGQPGSDKAGRLGLLNLSPGKTCGTSPCRHPVTTQRFAMREIVGPARARNAQVPSKFTRLAKPRPFAPGPPISAWEDVSWRCPTLFLQGRRSESLWVKDFKLWANAEVITSTPGLGSE